MATKMVYRYEVRDREGLFAGGELKLSTRPNLGETIILPDDSSSYSVQEVIHDTKHDKVMLVLSKYVEPGGIALV